MTKQEYNLTVKPLLTALTQLEKRVRKAHDPRHAIGWPRYFDKAMYEAQAAITQAIENRP